MFALLISCSFEGQFMFQKDPRWSYMAKLQTDEERYQLCRKLWKSLVVPDPNMNLTYFGYLKRKRNDAVSGNSKFRFMWQCQLINPFWCSFLSFITSPPYIFQE